MADDTSREVVLGASANWPSGVTAAGAIWPSGIAPAAFPVARLVETADGYSPELYIATPAAGSVITGAIDLKVGADRPEVVAPLGGYRAALAAAGHARVAKLRVNEWIQAGHTCIACGREHAGCCGQCPHYRPLS